MKKLHDVPKNDAEKATPKPVGRIRRFLGRHPVLESCARNIGIVSTSALLGAAACAKMAEEYVPAACVVLSPDAARALSAASAGMEIPLLGGMVLNVLAVDGEENTVTVSISIGSVRSEPREINAGSVGEVAGVEVTVCGISGGAASISTNPGPNPAMRVVRNKREETMWAPICDDDVEKKQRAAIVRAEVLIDGEWVEKVIAVRLALDAPLRPSQYISRACGLILGDGRSRVMELHENGNMELLDEVRVDGEVPKGSLLMVPTPQGPVFVRIESPEPGQRSDSMVIVTDEMGRELFQGAVPFKRRHITFTSPDGGGALAFGMVSANGDEASRMVKVLAGSPAALLIAASPYYRTADGVFWITGMQFDGEGLKGMELVRENVPFPEGFGEH
ncbi:MAG: hypothetical protein PHY95_04505 [Candidatus ainarchaeum sp.]|nr:hypothetical protein [Candidatus ainarchaeum sp.]